MIEGDALDFDPRPHLDAGPARIVANLPYNIATALLLRWLSIEPWPPFYDSLVLMFQREVAQRIVAKAGDDSYGRLSVITGWRTEARDSFRREPVRLRAAAEGDLLGRPPRSARRAAPVRAR